METGRPSYIHIERPRLQLRQATGEKRTHAIDRRRRPHIKEELTPPEDSEGLNSFITHFDKNWQKEKLPRDWFNLNGNVGFNIELQMKLLKDTSQENVSDWKQKAEYVLKGFTLEYLSKHVVYPCKYQKDPHDPTRMIDPQYSNQDMIEVVSEEERNGSVRQSLKDLKSYFLNGGEMAVMVSPSGPSGLQTRDKKPITYPDSYFFIMKRDGDTVTNFTVKTDFSHRECRDVIYQLTGKLLSPTAPLEEYARALAYISPDTKSSIKDVSDVVGILEKTRLKKDSMKAFKNTEWSSVYEDIQQSEKLYEFNDKASAMLGAFKEYCDEGNHTKLELQKGLAATLLRISKIMLSDQEEDTQKYRPVDMKQASWYEPLPKAQLRYAPATFGAVLDRVAKIPGCAGGGSSTVSNSVYVQSVIPRVGVIESDEQDKYGSRTFTCPDCNETNKRPHNELLKKCQHCGSKKVACDD